MEQPAVFGLTIVGATLLLFLVLAWAAAADNDVPKGSLHPRAAEEIRACSFCGLNMPSKQDVGCPVIEAFGIVMAESKRATAEGPSLP
jgi:hypothetical protein